MESLTASGGPEETPIYQEVPTMTARQVAAWFIYKEEEEGKMEEGTGKAHLAGTRRAQLPKESQALGTSRG